MNEKTTRPLEERLQKLERGNRNLKRVWVGTLILVASILLTAFSQEEKAAEEVKARQFTLVNSEGNKLARLHATPSVSGVGLSYYDENGNQRATFYVNDSGSGLSFLGVGGDVLERYLDPPIQMHWEIGKGPSLTLRDAAGFKTVIGTVELVTTTTGEEHKTSAASIRMFDKEGKVIWQAPR